MSVQGCVSCWKDRLILLGYALISGVLGRKNTRMMNRSNKWGAKGTWGDEGIGEIDGYMR